MKFSIFNIMDCHPSHGQSVISQQQSAINQCLLAEQLGFDTYFIAEHHFTQYGIMPSPFVFLSAISAITKKINLGVSVAVAPFYDPRRLAEDIAQLDLLSQGRVIVGLGSGFDQREFNGFGIPIQDKRERTNEVKSILKELLSNKSFDNLKGNYYTGKNIQLNIPTFNNVLDRIYTASAGTQGAYYIGKNSEKMMLSPFETIHSSFDDLSVAMAGYNKGAKESDYEASSPIVTMFCHPATSQEEAKSNCLTAFDRYVSSRSPNPLPINSEGQFYNGYVNNQLTLIGSVDTVIKQIDKMKDVGVEHIALLFNFGAIETTKIEQSMRIFATEIMPRYIE